MRRLAAPLLGLALVTGACGQGGNVSDIEIAGTQAAEPSGGTDATGTFAIDGVPDVVATAAKGLDTPWGLDFLPDGRAIVTERDSGRVLLVTGPDLTGGATDDLGTVVEAGTVPGVQAQGEGGLLGVAVSPNFVQDGLVYLYLTTAKDNRVVRSRLENDRLGAFEPIITGLPSGTRHNGGRMDFGPEGFLYVTTGEIGDETLARKKNSRAGKILRYTVEGKPAPGNPFETAVWSWGHRNVEGITWDADGSLWATEFGDATADELNRILPGEDYGWPEAEGFDGPKKYTQPALTWKPADASPAGIAFANGYLWMASLRGERLWRIKVMGGEATDPAAYFEAEGKEPSTYGRLRTVVVAPDGRLWLTTSNEDGRGTPAKGDDRILVIEP